MLTLRKAHKLSGTVTVPGDKSISHRAVMFGSLAKGTTEVTGFLSGADCLSTIECFRRLGVEIDCDAPAGHVLVHGKGMHGLAPADKSKEAQLYTGNSGTTTRIISGILAPQPFTTILSGDDSINHRPMKRVITPLSLMGASICSMHGNDCAPLRITGTPLRGICYESPVASAQVKSAILCAGLYAQGQTSVIEPTLSRDHTERMLSAFGADLKTDIDKETGKAKIIISPCQELCAQQIQVPGDISSAAYFIAAGLLVPGAEVTIRNVGINETRAGILQVAKAMGASIEYINARNDAEPIADLIVKCSTLHGTVIEGALIPTLIDELPVIAVMAAAAEGTTIVRDAAELKVKECNRIEAVTENLRAMGADITPTEDGFIIEGGKPLHGALIDPRLDHRIAMSFAVAALIAEGETTIKDEQCVTISYPAFYKDLASLTQN